MNSSPPIWAATTARWSPSRIQARVRPRYGEQDRARGLLRASRSSCASARRTRVRRGPERQRGTMGVHRGRPRGTRQRDQRDLHIDAPHVSTPASRGREAPRTTTSNGRADRRASAVDRAGMPRRAGSGTGRRSSSCVGHPATCSSSDPSSGLSSAPAATAGAGEVGTSQPAAPPGRIPAPGGGSSSRGVGNCRDAAEPRNLYEPLSGRDQCTAGDRVHYLRASSTRGPRAPAHRALAARLPATSGRAVEVTGDRYRSRAPEDLRHSRWESYEPPELAMH